MKTKLPWILTALLAIALVAVVAARPKTTTPGPAPQKHVRYWVDPMHPQYKSDKPGKAPDCGMDLVPVYDDALATPSNVSGYASVKMTSERQQLIGVKTAVV